jgi:hypothetical protein
LPASGLCYGHCDRRMNLSYFGSDQLSPGACWGFFIRMA